MTQQAEKSRVQIGFLRVAQTDLGYVGGLLVTNHLGRPVEFQCTTPVRPNRTQEILYGPTLQPFLYAELIGKTLFERINAKPDLILIQQESLLDLRHEIGVPVGCLVAESDRSRDLPDQTRLQLGRQLVRFHSEYPGDQEQVGRWCGGIPGDADLAEPLDRVKDALQETLRAGAVA
jgi:hypothetical protein